MLGGFINYFLVTNYIHKGITINGEKSRSICVGEILYSHGHFSKILSEKIAKYSDQLSTVPVKIVVKRLSNNKVIDLLGIKRLELNLEKTCIWVVCPSNKTSSIFTHNGDIYKLKLTTLSIGDVTKCFDNLKRAICTNDGMDLKHFLDLPVRVIITDERTGKILDCLDIATTLMNDTGSGIFYHCLVDDIRLISENPDLEKILNESEQRYATLMSKLIKNSQ